MHITELLFKIDKLLQMEDIYNCRLLVLYYNVLPNTSLATNRHPIKHPRLQPTFHTHTFISQTCKYNLPVLLNSINNQSDELTVIIRIVDIIIIIFNSLDNTFRIGKTKSYMLSKYLYQCSIPNCYICQI